MNPPQWAAGLRGRLEPLDAAWDAGSQPPPDERDSAVLVLLAAVAEPDVVLTVRSPALAHHAGQMALPGGGREPQDRRPADTALREAAEEIGLPAEAVELLGQLGGRQVAVSRNRVRVVVGLWSGAVPLAQWDATEVAQVVRWPIARLADPANRVVARHPRGGTGPAWVIDDLFLWGFTGFVIDAVLSTGGWQRPWDTTRLVEVPARFR